MRTLQGKADLDAKVAVFSPEEAKHARVIRLEKGEEILVLDLTMHKSFPCRITSLDPLQGQIVPDSRPSRELDISSVLLLPLLKRDNFEFCLQKGTELGVTCFVPYISSRVIKRVSKEEFEEKRERFEKIILEAVEQSNRNCLPELSGLKNFKELAFLKGDYKYLAYEEQAIKGEKMPLSPLKKGETVLTAIGPEGGFDPEEAAYLIKNGFVPISLGKRILRAETAVCAALSLVAYKGE